VIESEKKSAGRIDFIFADDETVRDVNIEFLNHDYCTDVITFDYSSGKEVSGEIYIGTGTVTKNAEIYNEWVGEEMRRVMVHAVLHLCGYGDSDNNAASVMRNKEDIYLRLYRDEFHV